MFDEFGRRYPGRFQAGQLRTLQRRFRDWRALRGADREVYFAQRHHRGEQSQSDFTDMRSLGVTIAGVAFEHLVYHFVLTYSNWESVSRCHTETFEALSEGLQEALWRLGGVPEEHRTDNLSAATHELAKSRGRGLELIRFCGHPDTVVRRCSDVEETTAVRAGVPAPVRRAGFAVELFRAGRTVKELAREFECSASAIRNWVRQADRDQGRREDGLTSSDLEELRRLRRELRRVREERDILAKATAWFARETGSVPGRSSGS